MQVHERIRHIQFRAESEDEIAGSRLRHAEDREVEQLLMDRIGVRQPRLQGLRKILDLVASAEVEREPPDVLDQDRLGLDEVDQVQIGGE